MSNLKKKLNNKLDTKLDNKLYTKLNYFQLFNIQQDVILHQSVLEQLEQKLIQKMQQIHPDKLMLADKDTGVNNIIYTAAIYNAAYDVLIDDLKRIEYVLLCNDYDIKDVNLFKNNKEYNIYLMQLMIWQEEIEELEKNIINDGQNEQISKKYAEFQNLKSQLLQEIKYAFDNSLYNDVAIKYFKLKSVNHLFEKISVLL